MTLLEALVATKPGGVSGARVVHIVFTDDGDSAYLSEIALEELVPMLEEWCRQQRAEMAVH